MKDNIYNDNMGTSLHFREHAFQQVFPSVPQTGLKSSGHAQKRSSHCDMGTSVAPLERIWYNILRRIFP